MTLRHSISENLDNKEIKTRTELVHTGIKTVGAVEGT